jgi:predicted nucleic acid-binding protein
MSAEFVDTNILIYAHEPDMGPKQARAIELLARLAEGSSGALSMQVLIEFYSAATRKLAISSPAAEEIVLDLNSWMTIHRPEPADIIRAAGLQRRYHIAWFDALILNSALQLGCTTLWMTEDLNHGQRYSTVVARNPFA